MKSGQMNERVDDGREVDGMGEWGEKGANLSQKEHLLWTLDSPSSNETIYYKAQRLQWQEGSH